MSKKVRVPLAALATLLLTAICVPLAGAAKDETTLVSRQSDADGGAAGAQSSTQPSVSRDGRVVAFTSSSENLSDADGNQRQDVFVRDLETNTTTLVSRQSTADGGAVGDDASLSPAISANGRFVTFRSLADNLSDEDDDSVNQNVFVRDLETDTTTLVSRQSAADGGAPADGASTDPAISGDGRFVAFESLAENLGANDAQTNVFVRDLQTSTTTLVARQSAADGGAPADAGSQTPSLSAGGRFVAFDSDADNLSDADEDDSVLNLFVRDLVAETTTLVSRASDGAGADDDSFGPVISADGRSVAFDSQGDNLSDEDNNAFDNVFVRDLQADATTLVSRQSAADGGASGNADSTGPSISADGRFVAFDSEADNLSDADNDAFFNVVVRDLEANTTTLVSRQSAADGGAGGDGDSVGTLSSMSANGRFAAFFSDADNLSAVDIDGTTDVFVRDVLGDGGGGGGDLTLELAAKKRQKAGKPVKVKATCSEDCALKARGRAKREGRKKLRLKRAEAELAADETQKLRLKPSKKVARKLRRAGRAKVRITAKATDAAGNEATDSVKVKLRRAGR